MYEGHLSLCPEHRHAVGVFPHGKPRRTCTSRWCLQTLSSDQTSTSLGTGHRLRDKTELNSSRHNIHQGLYVLHVFRPFVYICEPLHYLKCTVWIAVSDFSLSQDCDTSVCQLSLRGSLGRCSEADSSEFRLAV